MDLMHALQRLLYGIAVFVMALVVMSAIVGLAFAWVCDDDEDDDNLI